MGQAAAPAYCVRSCTGLLSHGIRVRHARDTCAQARHCTASPWHRRRGCWVSTRRSSLVGRSRTTWSSWSVTRIGATQARRSGTLSLTLTLALTPTLTRHAAVGVQRGWTSRGRDVRGATAWSKWPRSQPPMRPRTALEARPLAPGRRLGPRGAPSPLGCRGGAAATFWYLAQPRRSRLFRTPKAPATRKFQPLRMLTNPLRKKAPEDAADSEAA